MGSPKPANHSAPVVLTFAGRSQAASANEAMAMGHATALAKAPAVLSGCSKLKVSPMSATTKAAQTTDEEGPELAREDGQPADGEDEEQDVPHGIDEAGPRRDRAVVCVKCANRSARAAESAATANPAITPSREVARKTPSVAAPDEHGEAHEGQRIEREIEDVGGRRDRG